MNVLAKLRSAVTDKDETSRSMPFICKAVIIMIVIGVAIRLLLGFFLTYVFDIFYWGVTIQNINSGNGLYELTGYFYTPLWGYFLGLEAMFQDLIGVAVIGEHITEAFPIEGMDGYFSSTITAIAFNMSIKLMFLISDLVVGYLIFWIIRDITKDRRKAVLGFALWFLCPFVMTVGSVIGQFDTICVMMTLLAVIMLRKDRYVESGVMLCMATLMKFFPGFLIFIFVAYILSKNRENGEVKRKLTMFLTGIAAAAVILFLPQMLNGTMADSFLFVTSRLSEGMGSGMIESVAGYAALFVYIVAIAVSIIFALRILKNDDKERSDRLLFDALLVTTAAMLLFPPLPQYLLLLLPFVIFVMVSDRRYVIPYCLFAVGTTIVSIAGGPANLAAVAAYTGLIDMAHLMHLVTVSNDPLQIIGFTGYAIQYAGILYVMWIRFGERIKGKMKSITGKQTDKEEPDGSAQ
jgi:hypothetical protein